MINQNFAQKVVIASLMLFPAVAFGAITDIIGAEEFVFTTLFRLGMLFWVMILAFFAWGIIKFIYNADDSAEREKGRKYIVWALIAIVVLVSLWALVGMLLDSFGIGTLGSPGFVDKNGNPI